MLKTFSGLENNWFNNSRCFKVTHTHKNPIKTNKPPFPKVMLYGKLFLKWKKQSLQSNASSALWPSYSNNWQRPSTAHIPSGQMEISISWIFKIFRWKVKYLVNTPDVFSSECHTSLDFQMDFPSTPYSCMILGIFLVFLVLLQSRH